MVSRTNLPRILTILAVTSIALLLRWWAVQRLPIDYDELAYFRAAQEYAEILRGGHYGLLTIYSFNSEHPPLAKLVYSLPLLRFPLFPDVEEHPTTVPINTLPFLEPFLILRRLSMVFGGLQVLVISLLDPLAGLWLAVHSLTIKYTSVIYLEALPALTSVVAVLAFQEGWPGREPVDWHDMPLSKKRKTLVWLGISAAGVGASAGSKYIYGTCGIAILAYAIWRLVSDREMIRARLLLLFCWSALVLIVFFASDPYLWRQTWSHLSESLQFSLKYSQKIAEKANAYPWWQPIVWLAKPVQWQPRIAIPSDPGDFLILFDSGIAALALLGLRPLWKKYPLMIFWLGVGLLFLFVWKTKWPQYVMIVTAPLCLAAGEGTRSGLKWVIGAISSFKGEN
jgi:hypothetical protein